MRYKALPLSVRASRPEPPSSGPQHDPHRPPRRRARDVVATLPILLLVPALVIPLLVISATGPTLTVSGTATPGHNVTLSGSNFEPGIKVRLTWDGSAKRMPNATVSDAGTFEVDVKIPDGATTGDHEIAAGRGRAVIARATVTIAAPVAAPEATPTATPTPAPKATATPTPAPTPTATPAPKSTSTTSSSTTTTTAGLSWNQRPYTADSAWNTPIAAGAAVDGHSASMVATIGANVGSDATQYSYPVYVASASTPRYSVPCTKYKCTIVTPSGTTRVAVLTGVPIPPLALPSNGSDGQMIVIDSTNGAEYDLWKAVRTTSGWSVSNGSVYNVAWDGTPSRYGSRGAGVPYFAGLIRPWEIAQGHIDHAIAFAYQGPEAGRCVFPASKTDGANTDWLAIPEGARLQLDPTLGTADFDRMGLSRTARIIATAMQRYGMYVIDRAGHPKIYVENLAANRYATTSWSDAATALTSSTVATIPYTKFRVMAMPSGYWSRSTTSTMHGSCYG
jgi:hypothetical protein